MESLEILDALFWLKKENTQAWNPFHKILRLLFPPSLYCLFKDGQFCLFEKRSSKNETIVLKTIVFEMDDTYDSF